MPINPRHVQWGIYGVLGLLMAYELFAAFSGQPGATLSEVVWSMRDQPMVPLIVGVLIGHLFWTR